MKPIDLKEALKPLEIQLRLLSLIHKIPAAGTLDRMNALNATGLISSFSRADLTFAFETLWALRFRKQLEGHRRPVRTDDGLDPRTLSNLERSNLLSCLETVDAFVKRRALEIQRT
jgi:signal-transduction protein with cAMP-binding, CBS, and nucleotidyltransferase domain